MTIRKIAALAAPLVMAAACGGSYGANEPELPGTTANAAALASAHETILSTDGSAAMEQFMRENAHLGKWAGDAEACARNFYDVGPGRVVDGANNRACAFGEVARGGSADAPAIAFTAVCPLAGAEAGADGEIPTEEVAFTFNFGQSLDAANLTVGDAEGVDVARCDVLLAPPEEADGDAEEGGEAE